MLFYCYLKKMFLTVFLFYFVFFIIMWVNQIVLKTRHGSLTIMVIWINLRTFYQSVKSSVFDQKRKMLRLGGYSCVQNVTIGKVAAWWVHIYSCDMVA